MRKNPKQIPLILTRFLRKKDKWVTQQAFFELDKSSFQECHNINSVTPKKWRSFWHLKSYEHASWSRKSTQGLKRKIEWERNCNFRKSCNLFSSHQTSKVGTFSFSLSTNRGYSPEEDIEQFGKFSASAELSASEWYISAITIALFGRSCCRAFDFRDNNPNPRKEDFL